MSDKVLVGLSKENAEVLKNLGTGLKGVVDDVIEKTNAVLVTLEGKTKNNLTDGAEAQVQEVARSCNKVMEATKDCIIGNLKLIAEKNEQIGGTDGERIEDVVYAFASIEAVPVHDAGIVAGGDPITESIMAQIGTGVATVVNALSDGLQSQKALFEEIVNSGELYAEGMLPIWEETYKPTANKLADSANAFKKDAAGACENAANIRRDVAGKASETASASKRDIAASVDASVEQVNKAVKDMF